MNTKLLPVLILLLLCNCMQQKESDLELIRKEITRQYLLPDVNEKQVKTLMETLQEDGTWPGIDYVDTARIAFQHVRHLNNMTQMARAYKKNESPHNGDKKLKQAITSSLNYWLTHDFICENWWNNQIGTPSTMLELLYVLDEELSTAEKEKMLRIAGRANMDASGARPSGDRIKIAALYAKTELFKRDEQKFEELLVIIQGEMKFYQKEDEVATAEGRRNKNYFAGGRGMQADYSFHHRPDRVNNTTTYGQGFLNAFVEFASLVNGTKYQFSDASLQLAINYFLDGICKQMVYGRSVDPNVLNRDMSRPGAGGIAGSALPEKLMTLTDYRKTELENVVKARNIEAFQAESFAKCFWQTEYFSFQRPAFFTSVRMYSTRNANMEQPYNGEGLLNHYRADGANYLSQSGHEYFNIAPVFDYRKIPGTTVVQVDTMPSENQIQKKGLTDFVGGVTDGLYGAVAFDFKSPHNPLSAKKSWFFFDNLYVCLGADIQSTDRFPVATTLNQCLLQGDVYVNDGRESKPITKGLHNLQQVKWIFHDNVGYLFPTPQKVGLSNQAQSGSWYRVNRQTSTSKETITKDVFCAWLDHGIRPSNHTYAYIVMPGTDLPAIEKYQSNPSVTILSNTGKIQAVTNEKQAYCIFYEAGKIRINQNLQIGVDVPCMLMIKLKNNRLHTFSASDPSRQSHMLKLTIESGNENGKTETNVLSFSFPQNDDAGSSKK